MFLRSILMIKKLCSCNLVRFLNMVCLVMEKLNCYLIFGYVFFGCDFGIKVYFN